MKKLALTSLLAVFAVSGAHAANVIDGNPMYRPGEGRFYSETSFATDTDFDSYELGEKFGFGITDKLSIELDTILSYDDISDGFGWKYLQLGLSYRYMDQGNWKADLYGNVAQFYTTGEDFETLRTDRYNWKAGTKVGYVTHDWTVAGTAEFNYLKDDMSGGDDDDWGLKLGMEGQYVFNSNWNMVAGLDYQFSLGDDKVWGDEDLNAKLGVNYNFDSTKYLGVYLTKELTSDFDERPLGFGIKFGVDF